MKTRSLWICLALAAATLFAYAQVYHFDFLAYDDPGHTTQNPHVRSGLTVEGFRWAFTSFEQWNWFPVTWLSHMACFQFFGFDAGLHHLVNVLIHILASMALFEFLSAATGSRWPSAFVAFMFALHPLHVESVAWITERKDVLCAFFWFLALWAWVRGRYVATLALFILGLMSKPMIVTFPFTLLLLDLWGQRRPWPRLILEKLPFFALSAAGCIVTFLAQKSGGAVQPLTVFPLTLRIENALITIWIYIFDTLWPSGLALAYAWPSHIPIWQAGLAAAALTAVTYAVLVPLRGRRYLGFGWLWFLVTLIPVIGLVQVGPQSRADRYMYVPMVGLAVMLAWGVADFVRSRPRARAWIAPLACGACLAMAVTTWAQTGYWRNAELLFRHTLAVTGENELAYTWLAAQLDHNPATWPEALADLQAAARLNPASSMGHANLANMYEVMGRSPEAISQYEQALLADSGNAAAHDGLGKILAKQGRLPEALAHFRTVQRLDPGNPQGRIDTAAALLAAGQSAEGIRLLQEGLTKYPGEPRIYNMLGYALIGIPGRVDEGVERLERAVALSPDFADAHNNLGIAMFRTGRIDLAVEHFEAAIRLDPGFAGAHRNLGVALLRVPGRQGEGVDHLRVAQRLAPDPALRRMLEEPGAPQ